MLNKKKIKKVKIVYLNESISKKPQIIIGNLLKIKNQGKNVKILRKLAYENFIQTFCLDNNVKVKKIYFFN